MWNFIKEFWLFILALIILPFLFKLPALFPFMDFSQANETAGSINGFTTPIISFISVILLYKAFEKQNEAIKQQKEIFEKKLDIEKDKISQLESKESNKQEELYKTNIKIFTSIVGRLLKYYTIAGKNLKHFIDTEEKDILYINRIDQEINKDFEYFKKLQFVDLYKSLEYFIRENDNWENQFMNIIGILEYYNEVIAAIESDIMKRSDVKKEEFDFIIYNVDKLFLKFMNPKVLAIFDISALKEIFHNQNENIKDFKGTDFKVYRDSFLIPNLNLAEGFDITNNIDPDIKDVVNDLNILRKKINNMELTYNSYIVNYKITHERMFLDLKYIESVQRFIQTCEKSILKQ